MFKNNEITITKQDVLWINYYYHWKHSGLTKAVWCDANEIDYESFENIIHNLVLRGLIIEDNENAILNIDLPNKEEKGKKKERKNNDDLWIGYYNDWKKSGLTQVEWCKANNVSYRSFKDKKYALKKKGLIELRGCPDYWMSCYETWLKSGLTRKEWCEINNISYATFIYYLKMFREQGMIGGAMDKWANYYSECKKSGLTQKEWCKVNGINYTSFRKAIMKCRKRGLISKCE